MPDTLTIALAAARDARDLATEPGVRDALAALIISLCGTEADEPSAVTHSLLDAKRAAYMAEGAGYAVARATHAATDAAYVHLAHVADVAEAEERLRVARYVRNAAALLAHYDAERAADVAALARHLIDYDHDNVASMRRYLAEVGATIDTVADVLAATA